MDYRAGDRLRPPYVSFHSTPAPHPVVFSPRRKTVTAYVGSVAVGSAHPVVVQSMTNTDTADPVSTAEQVSALARAGLQLVRVTVNNEEAAAAVPEMARRVADAGVSFTIHEGSAIDEGLWDFFYRCYCGTYAAHHSSPYLSRDFFSRMARDLPEHWVLFVARRQGQPVAASLIAIDRGTGWAWGRYWGATESIPCLHFEACYYQPLAWCIAQGFNRFEGGAQGEHKMARGLLPVRTASAHWIRDVRFEAAIADFLTREGTGIEAYADELRDRSPFRKPSPEAV